MLLSSNKLVVSSGILIFLADDFGQRALVGKVCMDRNNAVKHYKETIQESQEETCRWVSTAPYVI